MAYKIEITDLVGDQPNYSWVIRGRSESQKYRDLIRDIKALAGWPDSTRVVVADYGGSLEVRPRGIPEIAFVDPTVE